MQRAGARLVASLFQCVFMIDNWQQIGVIVALAVATWYLLSRIWRLVSGRGASGHGGCGGCAKCPSTAADTSLPVVPIEMSFGERSVNRP
jgi:hypothetical protein